MRLVYAIVAAREYLVHEAWAPRRKASHFSVGIHGDDAPAFGARLTSRGQDGGVVSGEMRPDELERRLRQRLDALGPARRAELLPILMLPDFERADRIGPY